jgi:hypothetical protein
MLQITSPSSLSKIRYQAKKRGFRVLRDGCGCFSLINTKVEPPRPLIGVDHVPLWVIEQVIFTPLPEPRPRRKRSNGAPQASHPAATSFTHLVDLLKAQGGAR